MQPDSEREESTRSSRSNPTRSFVRAFVAASYLLGKRRHALSSHVAATDPVAREALREITEQQSHPARERRARVLAGEVGRLIRSLGAQRIK